jgi:bifunctional DNA-binding transcriptional regulator/antitoxin component of YhaV-PrlF toxin-antitoxin module
MTTRVSSKGQVVLPAALRRKLRLRSGDAPKAREMLSRLKRADGVKFAFLADANGADLLPTWVKASKQVTDGHSVRLAEANAAVLATFDQNIPGSFVIPQ